MGRINLGRVVLGGIVAGIVIDIWEGVMRGILLNAEGARMLAALHVRNAISARQMAAFNVWGIVVGILAVLLYAAIRPRVGAGPKTAVIAGLLTWTLVFAIGAMPFAFMHLLPVAFAVKTACSEGVMMIVAGLVGAALYKEGAEGSPSGEAEPSYAGAGAGKAR
jgi:hypothetical protein